MKLVDKKFKWDMLITSFIPLWISIIIIYGYNLINYIINCNLPYKNLMEYLSNLFFNNIIEFIGILILIIVSFNSIHGINKFLREQKNSRNKQSGKLLKTKKIKTLSSDFLLAYILPMTAFDFSSVRDIILFIVYFTLLAWICLRNNNIYTNILLEIKGYKMYECDIQCTVLNQATTYSDSLVISQKDLTMQINNNVDFWDFENYIYLVLGDEML